MQTTRLGRLVLGTGAPRIIVSLMAEDFDAVGREAEFYGERQEGFDILEWRVDFYRNAANTEEVLAAGLALREALPETPLLFTFRSRREGGERELAPAAYAGLLSGAASSGLFDALDLELFSEKDVLENVLAAARTHGVRVVMSSHDFLRTPPEEEMLERLVRMEALGADVPKLAVMPQAPADVLALLSATVRYSERPSARPVITMSMGGAGVLSRVAGDFSGSCATFGALRRASAPGQMNVTDLRRVLEALHAASGRT